MTPGEFGEVMRFAGLAADRAGKPAAAVGGNLQMQFVWLFASLQTLIDQPPRRRHAKPQSQYGRRVHTRPAHLDLRQCASVLVTLHRDRGASHDATPPTPPGIRVRTTAVRRIKRPPAYP